MASAYIPSDHTLVRYVQWAKLRRDADDNVLGVLPDAFRLRKGEKYLSASWLEFFDDARPACIVKTVQMFRASKMPPTPKSGFTMGKVSSIAETAAKYDAPIRMVHEPSEQDGLPAHTAVRRWPSDNEDLFDEISTDIWNELVLNKDVPQ